MTPPLTNASGHGKIEERSRWTWARIRRGILRRLNNRTMDARDRIFLPVAAAGGALASLFYATVGGAFHGEHAAVARGRLRYRREANRASRHFYKLRRNTHRLEKGLVMRPRRVTFAEDYIGETVDCYASLVNLAERDPDLVDADELQWSHDVLTNYFDVVGHTRRIDMARSHFAAAAEPASVKRESQFAPYARDLSASAPVSYADLAALSQRRRSVRWYLPRRVPHELIDRALDIAAQAPSACNRQPFEFRVIDDPAVLETVSRIPLGTGGFAHNLPALAVVVGKLRAFANERDRHLIYIDGALASMAFIYALETLGLSSCCLNWADIGSRERQIARALDLGSDERVVLLIAFGYPDPAGLVP
jgi:nitroreductase